MGQDLFDHLIQIWKPMIQRNDHTDICRCHPITSAKHCYPSAKNISAHPYMCIHLTVQNSYRRYCLYSNRYSPELPSPEPLQELNVPRIDRMSPHPPPPQILSQYKLPAADVHFRRPRPEDEGKENRVRFGKNIFVGKLQIILGNCGECVIGDHTKFIDTQINAAYASVRIGADCLFSSNVVIRTHDEHYIFDKDSLERLNRPLDVIIHPQVWVCENVRLLPGAYIGTGSV